MKLADSDAYLTRFQELYPIKIDLSLGRIEHLLHKLGNPHLRLPPVIHVGGTNGKGSTIAFMRAILEAAGLRVHVFTSPHLVRFHERIRLADQSGGKSSGKLVSEAVLVDVFERISRVNGDDPITFFEITTAAALLLFSEYPADVVLLEVGLGGRVDATNVIPHPAASVITPISLDHKEYLGDRVEMIAYEKAGIFKRGAYAILAPQSDETRAVLEREAAKTGAKAMIGGQDFDAHEEGGRLIYQDEHTLYDLPLPRLSGRHQYDNAATAIATIRQVFAAKFVKNEITLAHISEGLRQIEWPARLQRLHGNLAKLAPKGAEIWLDGGHNADGARAIAETMVSFEERNPAPLILLIGLMARKDFAAILHPFEGLVQELYALPIQAEKGARPPEDIIAEARKQGFHAALAGNLEESLRFLSSRNWPKPPRILIVGSLYLAGEVLAADGADLR